VLAIGLKVDVFKLGRGDGFVRAIKVTVCLVWRGI
jgi:hypothetical protein